MWPCRVVNQRATTFMRFDPTPTDHRLLHVGGPVSTLEPRHEVTLMIRNLNRCLLFDTPPIRQWRENHNITFYVPVSRRFRGDDHPLTGRRDFWYPRLQRPWGSLELAPASHQAVMLSSCGRLSPDGTGQAPRTSLHDQTSRILHV